MKINGRKFAEEWIEAWNSHDLDRILSHYSDDFEITTPMVKKILGIDTGTLKGKDKIRNYWENALKNIPDLHFKFKDAAESIDSIAIYYEAVLGKTAIEVMFFNEQAKVNRVIVHYT